MMNRAIVQAVERAAVVTPLTAAEAQTTPTPARWAGGSVRNDEGEALRAENRRLRAAVTHLEDELANAQERIAFLSQELTRVRAKLPPVLYRTRWR
jgi:TolA-binding protein